MALTPQTNTDLASLGAALRSRDDFVICGHVSPDGDCIGSQLALGLALRSLGKRASCLLAQDEPIDRQLAFLPGIADMVPAADFKGAARTFVALDVPTRERVGQAAAALRDACELSVTIDHHAVDTTMADLVYVDPDAASTTLLVWELLGHMGVQRSADVATCCYTGLVTDTGRFQYQNTDAAAMRAAADMVEAGADPAGVSRAVFQSRSVASVRLEGLALERMSFRAEGAAVLSWLTREDFEAVGAVKADAEPLIDALRAIVGVRAACMLREQDGLVRGSLRAKDDTDVASVARAFGGGGHRAAAGFTLDCTLAQARERVSRALVEALGEDPEGPEGLSEGERPE